MATFVKFTQETYDCYTYHCDDCDDHSGEYVSLADYQELESVCKEREKQIRRFQDACRVLQAKIDNLEVKNKQFRKALESIAQKALND